MRTKRTSSRLAELTFGRKKKQKWQRVADLNTARDKLGVAQLGGKVYAVGGITSRSGGKRNYA